MLKIGILQDEFGIKPQDNVEKIGRILLNSYREADIVILPEYSMINILDGLKPPEVYDKAEFLENSSYLTKISDLAGKLGVKILTHFIEKTINKPKCYSSSVLVEPSGRFVKLYSKMHLFDAYGYRESDFFKPGEKPSIKLNLKSMDLYVAICYDLRFPELFRTYSFMGAHGVIVQAGWVKGFLKEEILDKIAVTRSHENTYYLILVNQTGKLFTGRSGVYNPFGYKEVDLGFKQQYLEHSINPAVVEEARNTIPVAKQAMEKWIVKPI
ncbi:MAG: nitrilase-related carbon-nitrogen hydrolase [Desulfurococcaceae archaeon]